MISLENFKESLKDRSDIIDVLNSYIPLQKAGTNYKSLCPFHSEKTPSFTVNPVKQIFYCFGCQKGGDVIRFVMDYEGVDYITALKILSQKVGMVFPEQTNDRRSSNESGSAASLPKDTFYELHRKLSVWYQKQLRSSRGKEALDYVSKRGLDDDTLTKFQVGFAPNSWDDTMKWAKQNGISIDLLRTCGMITDRESEGKATKTYDRFRNRLMFPIWNEQSSVIAFSGRLISEDQVGGKYVNSPETPLFHKSKVLYGLPLAREGIKNQGFMILCEGQMDVIACHQAGVTNAVAPLGTAFTELHARLIKRYTDSITLLFDADTAGINAALKSIDVFLPAKLSTKVVLLNKGDDPDSLVRKHGRDALLKKISEAVDYFIFRMNIEFERQSPLTPDTKAKITETVLKDISRIESHTAKSEYCRILATRLQVPEHVVAQDLQRMAGRRPARKPYPRSENSRNNEAEPHEHRESKYEITAEGVLLELALHHGIFAHKMLEELPLEYITDSPTGRALNEVLAHTEQGEWSDASKIVLDSLAKYPSKDITKALFDPEFGPNTSKDTLRKAYADSLYQRVKDEINKRMNDLQQEISQLKTREEKNKLQRKLIDFRKQKDRHYHKLKHESGVM